MPLADFPEDTTSRKTRSVSLTVTEHCNLRCRYCYEPNKSHRLMNPTLARRVVEEFLLADDGFARVRFDFFGGEPLLNFPLIRDVVDWVHSRPATWRKPHLFFIGTNGTILTDEMKEWLVANKGCVKVGVSLDGNRTAHNINRSNSYDQVMQNLPFYREHWPEEPVKMTISAETIPYVADSIIELEQKKINFSANIVFEDIWGGPEQKDALLKEYAAQLDRLVDYYLDHPELTPAILLNRHTEYIVRPDAPIAVDRDCTRWCGSGHEMVMIGVDGDRAPCHRFSEWVTGKPTPKGPVNRQTEWKPDKCAQCKLVEMCPTCAGFNWEANGDAGIRTTYHCESFKLEVLASAKLQAGRLLRMPPETISGLPEADALNIKRRIEGILDLASNGV